MYPTHLYLCISVSFCICQKIIPFFTFSGHKGHLDFSWLLIQKQQRKKGKVKHNTSLAVSTPRPGHARTPSAGNCLPYTER